MMTVICRLKQYTVQISGVYTCTTQLENIEWVAGLYGRHDFESSLIIEIKLLIFTRVGTRKFQWCAYFSYPCSHKIIYIYIYKNIVLYRTIVIIFATNHGQNEIGSSISHKAHCYGCYYSSMPWLQYRLNYATIGVRPLGILQCCTKPSIWWLMPM